MINEATRLQIPVVGLVDSSMPWETYRKITYPVPANDSPEFVYLFCNLITKTILKERKGTFAERGEVTATGYDECGLVTVRFIFQILCGIRDVIHQSCLAFILFFDYILLSIDMDVLSSVIEFAGEMLN